MLLDWSTIEKVLVPQYNNRPNCFTRSSIDSPSEEKGDIYSIKRVDHTVIGVRSTAKPVPPAVDPSLFWDVVKGWGQTWLWENLIISGDLDWLAEAIEDNSLVAVTDGSFIRERYPHLNSAAFVFECSKGRGRLVGSFREYSPDACAYRGELLGLMAIHLILLGISEFHKGILGSVHIYSDCLGALERVEHLPPYHIPAECIPATLPPWWTLDSVDLGIVPPQPEKKSILIYHIFGLEFFGVHY